MFMHPVSFAELATEDGLRRLVPGTEAIQTASLSLNCSALSCNGIDEHRQTGHDEATAPYRNPRFTQPGSSAEPGRAAPQAGAAWVSCDAGDALARHS